MDQRVSHDPESVTKAVTSVRAKGVGSLHFWTGSSEIGNGPPIPPKVDILETMGERSPQNTHFSPLSTVRASCGVCVAVVVVAQTWGCDAQSRPESHTNPAAPDEPAQAEAVDSSPGEPAQAEAVNSSPEAEATAGPARPEREYDWLRRGPIREKHRPVPKVEGALEREVVHKVILEHRNELRSCYDSPSYLRTSTFGAHVTAEFIIEPEGEVSESKIEETSVKDVVVISCILDVVSRMVFPEPDDGQPVTVSWHFEL